MNSCIYKSPFGYIILKEKKGYLVQVCFVDKILKSDISKEYLEQPANNILKKSCEELENYFTGNLINFNLPINFQGTLFQRTAWEALLSIPYGETISYFEQAKHIKKPKAVRAIGNANSKNPIPIIVPCHRVIGKNGNLSGYSGGIAWKEFLIEHEKNIKHVRMS